MSTLIHDLRNQTVQRLEAIIAYLEAQCRIYAELCPHAARQMKDEQRRQMARVWKDLSTLGKELAAEHAFLAACDTCCRWWKELIEEPGKPRKRGGSAAIPRDTADLIVRLARENQIGNDAWGHRRIVGELKQLGIMVSASTVRRVLRRTGIPTAPQRGKSWTGPQVVAEHRPDTVAIDFTKVPIGFGTTVRMALVLAAIHQDTRRVRILGVTEHPNESWMLQTAQQITDPTNGFLAHMNAKAVRMDRDACFTARFRQSLEDAGYIVERTPPRMPWRNGFIERWFRTLKTSLTRKAIWLDEQALQEALIAFAHDHYWNERPHQGLDNAPPAGAASTIDTTADIVRHERCGGLIHDYRRAAA